MKKSISFLTNTNYVFLLRCLGLSEKPLSSYQIKRLMEKQTMEPSNSPYVYEMIKNLNPHNFGDSIINLFRWSEIPGKKIDEQNLVRKLKKYLGEKFNDGLNYEIRFEKNKAKDELTIKNPFTTVAKIGLYKCFDDSSYGKKKSEIATSKSQSRYRYPFPHLVIYQGDNGEEVLVYKKNDHIQLDLASNLDHYSRIAYQVGLTKSSPQALEIEFPQRVDEIYDEIDHIYQQQKENYIRNGDRIYPASPVGDEYEKLREELNELFQNSRYHKYYLNIRGLIMYILGELETESKSKRLHNKKIEKVLINLANNYSSKFPFLTYYKDFQKYCSDINRNRKYYGVELMKKISEELKYQINSSESFLNFWVTKRFFEEITLYLLYGIHEGLLENNTEYLRLIQKYSLSALNVIKQYLIEEHEKIESQMNYIDTQYIDAEELMRGYTFPLS